MLYLVESREFLFIILLQDLGPPFRVSKPEGGINESFALKRTDVQLVLLLS